MNRIIVALLTVCLLAVNGHAYGPRGHKLVGAIADRRVAKNKTLAGKVKALLDGLTLQRASTLPDEIKSWKCGSNSSGGTRINRELRAFVNANCDAEPSHDEFHYTNIPVFGDEDYDDGEVGRRDFDIVQMIPFCIRVLKGEEPETNDRAITKSVAVILLAHYLGDIHQPLHVGAEFFNNAGKPFEPTVSNDGFASQGGNTQYRNIQTKAGQRDIISGSAEEKKSPDGTFYAIWAGRVVKSQIHKGGWHLAALLEQALQ